MSTSPSPRFRHQECKVQFSQRDSALSPPGSPRLSRASGPARHPLDTRAPATLSLSSSLRQLPRQVPGHLPGLLHRRMGIRNPSSGLLGSQRAAAKGRFPEEVEISVS
ncbi:unnamed protein product [Rangifer tarandus platyrhynchus]|uniref:Uncharacterized protein n=2 Tax=Rangifer tarandus platyrhynchus TaxID=3082113 RepID=A0ABN8ZHM7_RANTA|nr:unnamed protein product [Rangifer tarandus platyrhynchus]CAI9708418.1 unnamed protein product [Rangifer tarandus platyrhynchus]